MVQSATAVFPSKKLFRSTPPSRTSITTNRPIAAWNWSSPSLRGPKPSVEAICIAFVSWMPCFRPRGAGRGVSVGTRCGRVPEPVPAPFFRAPFFDSSDSQKSHRCETRPAGRCPQARTCDALITPAAAASGFSVMGFTGGRRTTRTKRTTCSPCSFQWPPINSKPVLAADDALADDADARRPETGERHIWVQVVCGFG